MLTVMRLIVIFVLLFPLISMGQKLAVDNNSEVTKGGRKLKIKDKIARRDTTASALIEGQLYDAIVIKGDTIPIVSLPPAKATAKRVFKNMREEKKYRRLIYHIKKAYPYAKLAGEKMREVEEEVKDMTPRERKKRMKLLEKEIKRDYEGDLMKLSFTQGRILIKLLDRETGNISYDIVREFRGGFTAWFFQGIAKMFDYDLKSEYDPDGKDKLIEQIVQKIERGEL